VQGAARDTAFNTFCASIGAALTADRTLDGLCDWIEAEAPIPDNRARLKAQVRGSGRTTS
jgi:hypothetical protein